jgi:hypothetical protein
VRLFSAATAFSNTCAAALAFNGSDSVSFNVRRSVYLCISNRFGVVQVTAATFPASAFSVRLVAASVPTSVAATTSAPQH